MKELDTVESLSAGAARDPKPKLGLLQLNSVEIFLVLYEGPKVGLF